MKTCRYCNQPVVDGVVTFSYWGKQEFTCHKECRVQGEKQEAFECQSVDADCNDCKHFQRGQLAPKLVSHSRRTDGTLFDVIHQPDYFSGVCLKFSKPTIAQPNKWSGLECFEHRRATKP